MKLVVLDDRNIVLMLGAEVTPRDMWTLQEMLLERLPDWNVVLIGGADGSIVDLRDRPDLAEKGAELFRLVEQAMTEVV